MALRALIPKGIRYDRRRRTERQPMDRTFSGRFDSALVVITVREPENG